MAPRLARGVSQDVAEGRGPGRWEGEGGQPVEPGAAKPEPAAAVADPGFDGVDVQIDGERFPVQHGSVVIAAITSCTNTSNPSVMIAAGLLAKKAVEKGLKVPPYVKTSLAPGSRVVTDYFEQGGPRNLPRRSSASTPSATAARPASATAARCPSRSPRRSTRTTWSSPACSAAIATSKAASIRT